MKNWKDNIYFVLIEPKEPGNVGASARALKNMGFRNLVIIGRNELLTEKSRWMACNAVDILRSASFYEDLWSSIRDKNLVVGTSRRLGKRRGPILPLEGGAKRIRSMASENRVAILFGREDRGLYNEEVERCGFLITIPANRSAPSLNLSQAVMLVAYELSRETSVMETPLLVKQEELEILYGRIEKVLKDLGYIPRGNRDLERKIMNNIRHLLGRTGLTDWELRMLHGICSQIERYRAET